MAVQMDHDRNVPACPPGRDKSGVRKLIRIVRDDQRRRIGKEWILVLARIVPQQRHAMREHEVMNEIVLRISLVIRPRCENVFLHPRSVGLSSRTGPGPRIIAASAAELPSIRHVELALPVLDANRDRHPATVTLRFCRT